MYLNSIIFNKKAEKDLIQTMWFILTRRELYSGFDWDLSLVSEPYIMATNKERIENLEVGLGGLQANLSRMELGVNDKLHQLENAISKISEVLSTRQDPTSSNVNERNRQSSYGRSRENTEGR